MAPPLVATPSLYVVKQVCKFSLGHDRARALVHRDHAVPGADSSTTQAQLAADLAAMGDCRQGDSALAGASMRAGLIGAATGVLRALSGRRGRGLGLVTPVLLVLGAPERALRHAQGGAQRGQQSQGHIRRLQQRQPRSRPPRSTSDAALRLEVVGFFDDRAADRLQHGHRVRGWSGRLADLAALRRERNVDVIYIALPMRHVQRVLDLLDDLRDTTASIYYVPDIFVFDLIQSRSSDLNGVPVVALCETPFYGYRGITKRLIDVSVAGAVPVLLVSRIAADRHAGEAELARDRRCSVSAAMAWMARKSSSTSSERMTVIEDGAAGTTGVT